MLDAPLAFVPDIGEFFCECSDFYSGEFCNGTEGLLNPCHPSHETGNNCDGNATCMFNASDPGNFTCACEYGYLDLGGAIEGNCTDVNEWCVMLSQAAWAKTPRPSASQARAFKLDAPPSDSLALRIVVS